MPPLTNDLLDRSDIQCSEDFQTLTKTDLQCYDIVDYAKKMQICSFQGYPFLSFFNCQFIHFEYKLKYSIN